jgi:FdrA protein
MVEIAVVSAPGLPAVREAMEALRAGKHVVLLGGGISLGEEVGLKQAAAERELLLLGPGCSTAIIDGTGYGFTNVVRQGPVGIVGTLGAGIQEVSCLVDEVGISHAFGVGPRDLSQKVDGIGTLSALKFLEADKLTKVIVLVGRAPATSMARRVLDAVGTIGKPAVVCFLGGDTKLISKAGATPAATFEDAAIKAVALARGEKPKAINFTLRPQEVKAKVEREYSKFGYGQKYTRGLFSGSGLCADAMVILQELVGDVYSNVPLKPRLRLPDPRSSKRHTCVDFEAGALARVAPHPLIDLTHRCERMLKEARDWGAAVLLFDVVLGQGVHPDPAGELVKVVGEAKSTADRGGGYLSVVASVVGTAHDPQNLEAQRRKLEKAGVVVMPSNAQATRVAALIATKGRAWKKLSGGSRKKCS